MATYGVGRALLVRGPPIGNKLNGTKVLNHFTRSLTRDVTNALRVTPRNGEIAAYSTTVLQPPKIEKQTKSVSESLGRNLSAAADVAVAHEHEEEMGINMKTEIPGKKL